MPKYNAESMNAVPVGPIAEAVIQSDLNFSQVAMQCGWTRKKGRNSDLIVGDATRLKRRLGLASYTSHGKSGRVQQYISYDNAAVIAKAIQADPVDLGL